MTCDICSKPLKGTHFDAKTRDGPWAYMCPECFAKHGIALGTGLGQKYEKLGEKWIKTGG